MVTSFFPGLVALAASSIMLWHNIEFWARVIGQAGIAWAVVMEVVALFLWYRGTWKVAVFASAIVISGPLYILTGPIFSETSRSDVNAALVTETRNEIASLEVSLTQYNSNSGKRAGWASRIDGVQRRLDATRRELRNLLLQGEGKRHAFQQVIVIGLQVATVIVMMIAQVLAVSDLRVRFHLGNNDFEATEFFGVHQETEQRPRHFDNYVITLSERIQEVLDDFDGKQSRFAQACGVRPADISLVINHDKRRQEGKEIVSMRALEKIDRFLDAERGSRS